MRDFSHVRDFFASLLSDVFLISATMEKIIFLKKDPDVAFCSALTKESLDKIVSSIEKGECYYLKSPRRSGKTSLIIAVSRRLQEKKIEHQIFVATHHDLAHYEEFGIKIAAVQGSSATADVVIFDEPQLMDRDFVMGLGVRVPVVVHIGHDF